MYLEMVIEQQRVGEEAQCHWSTMSWGKEEIVEVKQAGGTTPLGVYKPLHEF